MTSKPRLLAHLAALLDVPGTPRRIGFVLAGLKRMNIEQLEELIRRLQKRGL